MCYIQNAKALRANGLNLMTTADINPSLSEQKVADGVSETDLDEPTKAEILADVKTGLQQALAGEGRPRERHWQKYALKSRTMLTLVKSRIYMWVGANRFIRPALPRTSRQRYTRSNVTSAKGG